MADKLTCQRHWVRSMIGWRRFGQAVPNDAHHALARLEARGQSQILLIQNVDRRTRPPGAGGDTNYMSQLLHRSSLQDVSNQGDITLQTEGLAGANRFQSYHSSAICKRASPMCCQIPKTVSVRRSLLT